MRNKGYIITFSVAVFGVVLAAVLQKLLVYPPMIFWIICGIVILVAMVLFVYGLKLKPEKQAETSKGLFIIDIIGYAFGNPNGQTRRTLILSVLFHVIPTRRVESLQIRILHHIISADWKPEAIGSNVLTDGGDIVFNIPDSIKQGKYTITLIAYSNGERFEFNPYEIEIPA